MVGGWFANGLGWVLCSVYLLRLLHGGSKRILAVCRNIPSLVTGCIYRPQLRCFFTQAAGADRGESHGPVTFLHCGEALGEARLVSFWGRGNLIWRGEGNWSAACLEISDFSLVNCSCTSIWIVGVVGFGCLTPCSPLKAHTHTSSRAGEEVFTEGRGCSPSLSPKQTCTWRALEERPVGSELQLHGQGRPL